MAKWIQMLSILFIVLGGNFRHKKIEIHLSKQRFMIQATPDHKRYRQQVTRKNLLKGVQRSNTKKINYIWNVREVSWWFWLVKLLHFGIWFVSYEPRTLELSPPNGFPIHFPKWYNLKFSNILKMGSIFRNLI